MAIPTRLDLDPASPSNYLSNLFGGVTAHTAGLNDMIDHIQAAEDTVGIDAAATDLLDYVRLHDGTDAGLFVPAASLMGLNPIPNAAFDIWQDGTSFSSIATSTWGPDGWIYAKVGAVVHDLLRSTDVPTVAQASKANYSLHLDVTTADASLAAGDLCIISTRIEGYNWKRLAEKPWSLRFWVKAAKTGVHYVSARNSGQDRSCVVAYTVNAADTWEEKQVAFPASPSAGTWDYTNGRGLQITWCLAAGTDFHTTAGAWQTGNFYAASDTVNEVDNTANNFRLALVGHPTLGPNALPFQPTTDFGLEELRCKRYNEPFDAAAGNEIMGWGAWYAATTAWYGIPLVPKRATPTLGTVSAANTFNAMTAGAGVVAVTTAPAIFLTARPDQLMVNVTASTATATAGQGSALLSASASALIPVISRIP